MDMRALPRIELHRPITFDDGSHGILVDFNYRYAFLSEPSFPYTVDSPKTCTLAPNVSLILEPVSGDSLKNRQGMLMKVMNWNELAYHPVFRQILHGWNETYQQDKREQEAELAASE